MLSFFTYSLQTLQMSMASVACDCTPLNIGKIYTHTLNGTNYKNRVSTMRCRPDNVLEDNRYTVPPNRTLHHSSFTIVRYHGTHWQHIKGCLTVAYRGRLSSNVFRPAHTVRRRDRVYGPVPVVEDIRFIGPVQQQGRGHTGAEERHCEWTRNMQWQVP